MKIEKNKLRKQNLNHITNFKTSGTIFNASKYTIHKILSIINFENSKSIIELGIGDGTITKALLSSMSDDSQLIGFDINSTFIEKCKSIEDKRLKIVNKSAEFLVEHLISLNLNKVDVVISTLPLSMINSHSIEKIFSQISQVLDKDGLFIQAIHNPFYILQINKTYKIKNIYFIMRNMPPYIIVVCKKD